MSSYFLILLSAVVGSILLSCSNNIVVNAFTTNTPSSSLRVRTNTIISTHRNHPLNFMFQQHNIIPFITKIQYPKCQPLYMFNNNSNKTKKITESEAKSAIDKVVKALQKDKSASTELGKLTKVNNILGYGSPKTNIIAVRFNASFQKSEKGLSSIPMKFGLGQTNVSEGRGTMVGQVKASVSIDSGKIVECSVFRDLGYGRAFNLKV